MCAAASALNLVAMVPAVAMAVSVTCVLFLVPAAALILTAYWAKDVRIMVSTLPRVVGVIVVLALRGLVPDVVPPILLCVGALLLALATFELAAQARRYPFARLSLAEKWCRELTRYRNDAWAAIVAGFSSLVLTAI